MSTGKLNQIWVSPGNAELQSALRSFGRRPGIVTSFLPGRLEAMQMMVDEDHDLDFKDFGELCGRLLNLMGLGISSIVTEGQVRSAVAAACELLPDDSPLRPSCEFVGTHQALARTLGELRHWRITHEDLEAAAAKSDSIDFSAHFSCLADLQRSVQALVESLGKEFGSDRAELCIESIPPSPLNSTRIFAVADGEVHPLFEDLLIWAADHGAKVTLVREKAHEECNGWYSKLFSDSNAAESHPRISIEDSADALAESEWVVRNCLRLLNQGTWGHDIAIVCRNLETYGPRLAIAANRFGVQIDPRYRVPLLTNGFAALTLEVLQTLASNDVRRFSRVFRSSYVGLSAEDRSELSDQIRIAYRTREKQWDTLRDWVLGDRERFGWLANLLEWREKCLLESVPGRQWIERLRDLIGEMPWLENSARATSPVGKRDIRAQTAMQRALSDLFSLYPKDRLDNLSHFVVLATRQWDQETMTLPGAESAIRVVSSEDQVGPVDHLFVLGMLEGTMPRRRVEDPILNDEHRSVLNQSLPHRRDLLLSTDRSAAERDVFVRICATPAESLNFSYPGTTKDRDNVPAFYLEEVARVVGGKVHRIHHSVSELSPPIGECLSMADILIAQAAIGPKEWPMPPRLQTQVAKDWVRLPEDAVTSPAELGRALQCHFRTAFTYRLSLRPTTRRAPWFRLSELAARVNLPQIPDRAMAAAALQSALDDEIQTAYSELESWELRLFEAEAKAKIAALLDREFAAREWWPTEESARAAYSKRLSEAGMLTEVQKNGLSVSFDRRIPIIAESHGIRFATVFEGDLSAISDSKEALTNESVHVHSDWLSHGLILYSMLGPESNRKGTREIGIQVDSLSGTRTMITFARPSQFPTPQGVPLKLRVIGTGDTNYNSILTRIRVLAVQAAASLRSGSIDATPGDHCESCPFGELCRNSQRYGEVRSPFEIIEGGR